MALALVRALLPQQLPRICQGLEAPLQGYEHTEFLLRGPMRVYLSPYSAVVTGAFDFRTE